MKNVISCFFIHVCLSACSLFAFISAQSQTDTPAPPLPTKRMLRPADIYRLPAISDAQISPGWQMDRLYPLYFGRRLSHV